MDTGTISFTVSSNCTLVWKSGSHYFHISNKARNCDVHLLVDYDWTELRVEYKHWVTLFLFARVPAHGKFTVFHCFPKSCSPSAVFKHLKASVLEVSVVHNIYKM